MGFIKAPPGVVTRYLWVGGIHGMTPRQLADLFAPYGSPTVVLPEDHPVSALQPQPAQPLLLPERPRSAPSSPPLSQPPLSPSLVPFATLMFAAGAEAATQATPVPFRPEGRSDTAAQDSPLVPHAPRAVLSQHQEQKHQDQQQEEQKQHPLDWGSSPQQIDATDPQSEADLRVAASSVPMPYYHAFLAFEAEGDAAAAAAAVPRNQPWEPADGRKIVVNFADVRRDKRPVPRPVATHAQDLGVPGLALLPDFITPDQERQLLRAVGLAEGEGQQEQQDGSVRALESETKASSAGDVLACGYVSGRGEGAGGGGARGPEVAGGGGWHCMARRRVQHFGYRFDYSTRNVDLYRPLGPLPPWARELADRIEALEQVLQPIDQLTVNEYDPGVGLAPHVDTHSAFTGPVISLSLGSHAVMEMRRGEVARPLLLPPRSLLIMAGESRYAWQHYIPHRVADLVEGQLRPRGRRVSLTFRKVRGFPCDCPYPDGCDSQQANLPPTRISQLAPTSSTEGRQPLQPQLQIHPQPQPQPQPRQHEHPGDGSGSNRPCCGHDGDGVPSTRQTHGGPPDGAQAAGAQAAGALDGSGGRDDEEGTEDDDEERLAALEAEYVHKVYDAIAPHFSSTRFAIWPRVRAFIESLPPGAVVADVGCGNGKYFGVRADLAVLGSDISEGLVSVAAQRLHPPGLPPSAAPRAADALVADALRLPYRPASCDAVLCIAVLHHLSSPARRVRLLRQLLRVLRPDGGRAIVTVWAVQQEDPCKTLAKWTRIEPPAGATTEAAAPTPAADGASTSSNDAAFGGAGGGGKGLDFFVPWNLPFHRTEAARAVKIARASAATAGSVTVAVGSGEKSQESDGKAGGTDPAPKVDEAKGAVVFHRYYHLFEAEELRELVSRALAEGPAGEQAKEAAEGCAANAGGSALGTAGVVDAGQGGPVQAWGVVEELFYDRSNWCVVFRRTR